MNEASDFKFVTRKWNIVNDESNANYSVKNEKMYGTEVLKSNLFNYKDAYILVRGDITILGNNVTQATFKNCAPFITCIKKIYRTTKSDDANLDLVMPMYNLLEYSSNYSDKTGSLRFYSKDEAISHDTNIVHGNACKSFRHKA